MNTMPLLELLHSIEKDGSLSQRAMAENLGVALGLVNGLLAKALEDGFIEADKSGPRHFYTLTPQGTAHKSALVAESLASSFHLLKKIRLQYEGLFEACENAQLFHVALVGVSELSTLAALAARSFNVRIGDIVSDAASLNAEKNYDAVIVCDLERPQETYDALVARGLSYPLFVPDILYVNAGVQKSLPSSTQGVKNYA